MTGRRWALTALAGIVVGLAISLFATDDARVVSLQVWLGTALILIAVAVGSALHARVPIGSLGLRPIVERAQDDAAETSPRPSDLIAMDRAVGASLHDPRMFTSALRPRLLEIADHHLRSFHGVDLRSDPTRAQAILGPTAWLIDVRDQGRSPTADELMDFAARLNGGRHGQ